MTRKTEKKTNAEFRKRTLYLKSKTNLWIKENPKTEKTAWAHIHGNWSIYMSNSCQSNRNVEGSMLASMETGVWLTVWGQLRVDILHTALTKGPSAAFILWIVASGMWGVSPKLLFLCCDLSKPVEFCCQTQLNSTFSTYFWLFKKIGSTEFKRKCPNALGTLSKIHVYLFF